MKCNKCSDECKYLLGTSGILDRKVSTNADKIRSMSDEELAKSSYLILDCKKCPKSKPVIEF